MVIPHTVANMSAHCKAPQSVGHFLKTHNIEALGTEWNRDGMPWSACLLVDSARDAFKCACTHGKCLRSLGATHLRLF